jgi:hypothetical protein
MMNRMLGFLSAAIAGEPVQAETRAKAIAHKVNIFADDHLILDSLYSLL